MGTINNANINESGIVTFDATAGNFLASTVQQNQILIGGNNNTITNLISTGDVGNPIVNQGTGVTPEFSANVVVDQITINNLPAQPNDGANKQYVDSVASNFSFLDSTVCATTANLQAAYNNGASGVGATLTNTGILESFSVDNYTPIATNRILVKNQTDQTQNGVYTLDTVGDSSTAWLLTRSTDYDAPAEITPGSLVSVLYGDTQAETFWAQTQNITQVGSDSIIFIPFGSAQSGALLAINNLSDVTDVPTSRANLGITDIATQTVNEYALLCGAANNGIYSLAEGQIGQVLTSNGTGQYPSWGANPNNPITSADIISITTPGTTTYVPSAGMKFIIVECIGGGGGSYSFTLTGSAGGYAKSTLSAAQVGTSQICIVGAGGSANQNGYPTSFGSLVIAEGGKAGASGISPIVPGGSGTGQFVIQGQSDASGINPAQSYFLGGNPPQYGSGGTKTSAGNGAIIITEFS